MNLLQGFKILLVDDNEDIIDVLKFSFENAGAEVLAKTDIKSALVLLLEEKNIHLVLSDFHMPNGTGVDLVKKMRAAGLKIPFILILSDKDMSESDMKSHGISKIISKPFDVDQVIVQMKDLIIQNSQS